MNRMLLGPDAEPTLLDQDIEQFLLATPRPDRGDVEDFLKLYVKGEARMFAAQKLVARGVPAGTVSDALAVVNGIQTIFTKRNVLGFLTMVSAVANGVHGYRRNQSIPWAMLWFGSGMVFPLITTAVSIGQGFGQKKG